MPAVTSEERIAWREYRVEQSALGRIVVVPALPEGFALFYTTRDFDGALDRDRARAITGIIRERFGIEGSLTTCHQVHGAAVRRVTAEGPKFSPGVAGESADVPLGDDGDDSLPSRAKCDALWSDENHVALGIKIADCLPVSLIDPVHAVIANVHSGWRGAVQRIIAGALEVLAGQTRFDAAAALAYLGPSIRVCCFEVGEEVVEQFRAVYRDADRFVDRSNAKPHLDVAALTIDGLREHGFAAERIFDSGLCTRCEGSIFHSYRRDGRGGGRNLAIVAQ